MVSLLCAIVVAWTFLLRSCEVICETGPYVAPVGLSIRDLMITSDGRLEVFIACSKTDQGGRGVVLAREMIDSPRCVVLATCKWAEIVGCRADLADGHPAFIDRHGRSIVPGMMTHWLRWAARCTGHPTPYLFSTHSCRIGGASVLHNEGLGESEVQAQGRWGSLVVRDYRRIPLVADATRGAFAATATSFV